jgi:hypothetical protein
LTDTIVFWGNPLRLNEITPPGFTVGLTVELVPGVLPLAPPGGSAYAVPTLSPRLRVAAAHTVAALLKGVEKRTVVRS